MGAFVPRVPRLPARPAGGLHVAAVRDRRRHAARRRDGHARSTARRSIAARRPARSSERLVVSEQVALPLGDGGVPLEEAALLGCAALTGVGAVLFAAGVEAGSTVLVVGAGGVGQFVVQGARIAGAAEIVCVDPLEERLELVQRLGATQVAQPDGLSALMKEGFADGVDYAFDAVGDPGDDEDRLSLDAKRRPHRHRRPARRWARRSSSIPTEFIRREKCADGDDLRLRGPGRRAAHPARARPFRRARSQVAARPAASRSTTRTTPSKPRWPASRAASSSSPDMAVEHVERLRVAWVDTDAGGRIHFSNAFRWAEQAETALRRKLGILEGWGDYPRKRAEAEFHQVLRFEDEIDVRVTPERRGRAPRSRGASRSRGTESCASTAAWSSSTSTRTAGRRR